jgi:hypothetical protein
MNMSESGRGISGHFRREARIMAGFFVILVAVGFLAAWLAPRIQQYVAVDRCLDAGGSYNYRTKTCEGARR